MQTPLVLLPLLLASLVATKSISIFSGSQIPLDEELAVPGKNPLYFCAKNADYSLDIKKVDLSPNPPEKGATLTIEAQGNFTEEVEEGAYINLSVKYGLITLIKMTVDLCEQMKEVDQECPLTGFKVIKKQVDIPKEVPKGNYHVFADVYTTDDKRITCLESTVHFD